MSLSNGCFWPNSAAGFSRGIPVSGFSFPAGFPVNGVGNCSEFRAVAAFWPAKFQQDGQKVKNSLLFSLIAGN
jgi:hypothetical protein